MTVRQCPRCPLRFATENELKWHLREEHRLVPPVPAPSTRPVGAARPSR